MPMMIEKARIGRLNALEGLGRNRGDGGALPQWMLPTKSTIRFKSVRAV